jgi:hypothetical protein
MKPVCSKIRHKPINNCNQIYNTLIKTRIVHIIAQNTFRSVSMTLVNIKDKIYLEMHREQL